MVHKNWKQNALIFVHHFASAQQLETCAQVIKTELAQPICNYCAYVL